MAATSSVRTVVHTVVHRGVHTVVHTEVSVRVCTVVHRGISIGDRTVVHRGVCTGVLCLGVSVNKDKMLSAVGSGNVIDSRCVVTMGFR